MTLAPLHTEDQLAELLRAASHPGKAARETLLSGQQRLDDAFAETPIRELVAARSTLVDGVLTAAWRFFSLDRDSNSALVAVGGYGRGELHPHSDVDLMILSAAKPCRETCDNLEKFIAFLWDIGLEIGHSVRTLDECVALARDDITIATNIMEARTLFGDDSLRATLAERTGPQQMWPSDQFFEAKRQEQEARHAKFNHTEYSLEPDLKNAPGGLRDLQTIA